MSDLDSWGEKTPGLEKTPKDSYETPIALGTP